MEETIAKIRRFRDERDWRQFHDPKSLAASVAIEAAELLELFQWLTPGEAHRQAAENRERVAEEIADVAIYLIELADVAGIDFVRALEAKLEKNALKYPARK
jgi:NTP pyrophosphatase (non-canonical NTP hydrolase)